MIPHYNSMDIFIKTHILYPVIIQPDPEAVGKVRGDS